MKLRLWVVSIAVLLVGGTATIVVLLALPGAAKALVFVALGTTAALAYSYGFSRASRHSVTHVMEAFREVLSQQAAGHQWPAFAAAYDRLHAMKRLELLGVLRARAQHLQWGNTVAAAGPPPMEVSECVACNLWWAPRFYGPRVGEPCTRCGKTTTTARLEITTTAGGAEPRPFCDHGVPEGRECLGCAMRSGPVVDDSDEVFDTTLQARLERLRREAAGASYEPFVMRNGRGQVKVPDFGGYGKRAEEAAEACPECHETRGQHRLLCESRGKTAETTQYGVMSDGRGHVSFSEARVRVDEKGRVVGAPPGARVSSTGRVELEFTNHAPTVDLGSDRHVCGLFYSRFEGRPYCEPCDEFGDGESMKQFDSFPSAPLVGMDLGTTDLPATAASCLRADVPTCHPAEGGQESRAEGEQDQLSEGTQDPPSEGAPVQRADGTPRHFHHYDDDGERERSVEDEALLAELTGQEAAR